MRPEGVDMPRSVESWFIGKKSPAALFSDISFVSGGKKRGFCPGRVAACHYA
jgi:hypothetical protein